jgi:hypothetical protein
MKAKQGEVAIIKLPCRMQSYCSHMEVVWLITCVSSQAPAVFNYETREAIGLLAADSPCLSGYIAA